MKKYLYLFIALAVLAGCKNRNKGKEAADAAPEEIELTVEPTDTLAAKKAAEALPEEPVFDIVTNMGTIRLLRQHPVPPRDQRIHDPRRRPLH